ncbi:hypothetical protein F4777DRAFT_477772 [Nemania sp. FL0916]|nr:hypothetical protein F4777DRAFT_477772 [Nemania sp. FL0916]
MLARLPRQDLPTSQGSLMLYTDECCQDSISESSVPLLSGDCQGAPFAGIRGVKLTSLPTCPDYGLPLLIVSNETSCKNPQSESTANSGVIGRCQSFSVTEIASFQFICYGKGVSSVPLPSTTTSWGWQSTTTNWGWQSTSRTTTAWAQSETQWTPTSTTDWDEPQSQTQWRPTSSTWGYGWGHESAVTLTVIQNEKETKDLGADSRFWVTLMVTMNDTVYEVRQPAPGYDVVQGGYSLCNGGNTVSQRDSVRVWVCLVIAWLLLFLL